MAFLTLDAEKLKSNYTYLNDLFSKKSIEWAVVTKLLCGNKTFLQEVLALDLKQVCDSRVTNLKMVKSIAPEVETVYIKPPPKRSIEGVVRYADISMNTEMQTIRLLSEEAKRQNKQHKVIIMIEMGELREGILGENLLRFYENVFQFSNITVVGVGTNLNCMYGVLPSHDKLIQLSLYTQLIEAKFNTEIQYISGGSSVTIPLIFEDLLPKAINHFRVGETLFLGTDVYHDTPFPKMYPDVFRLYAEVIEITKKTGVPVGKLGTNLKGESMEFEHQDRSQRSFRAILDLGLLDMDEKHVHLKDSSLEIVGASSDMIVVDLGDNPNNIKVGDLLECEMDYMGLLRIMNSKYIEKRVVHEKLLDIPESNIAAAGHTLHKHKTLAQE
ncbi:MAG: alanine/ornithine racemase family PLP-dependent enzyme [Chitinophagales bacterium]